MTERLQALGELWAAVDLFHPLVRDRRVDWDATVAQAMPSILSAEETSSLREAISQLLIGLDDGISTVCDEAGQKPDPVFWPSPGGDPSTVALLHLDDNHVLLRATDLEPFSTAPSGAPLIERLLSQATQSDGVVLDLRGCGPFLARALGRQLGKLLSGAIILPGVCRVVRLGSDPSLITPHLVGQSVLTTEVTRIEGGLERRLPDLVCIADSDSAGAGLALGLKAAHGSALVWVGDRAGLAGPPDTIPFAEGLSVKLALARYKLPEGFTPVEADTVLPTEAHDAIGVASSYLPGCRRITPDCETGSMPEAEATEPSPSTKESGLPDWPWRVLALYRLWSAGAYLYPYLADIRTNWDELLADHLPGVLAADCLLDYHRAVAHAMTVMKDSHGNTVSTALTEHLGTHWPPGLVVDEVEGKSVVMAAGESPSKLRIGDEVLAVDGESTASRLQHLAALFPASTPQWLAHRTHRRLLCGPVGSSAELTMLGGDGIDYKVGLTRTSSSPPNARPRLDTIEQIEPGITYIDLGRLEPGQVADAIGSMRQAGTAIIDLRAYPRATGFMIAAAMADRPTPVARTWWREPRLPRTALAATWQPGEARQEITHMVHPDGGTPLRCRLIVIIDRGCISQGEHTALALAAVADTVFVGEATAGANGNVVSLELSGDLRVAFTGLGVSWPNGRPLQRVGIQPDVPVQRTVAAVREDRDELLEAALRVALS